MLAIIAAIENETERNAIACIFEMYYARMRTTAYDILNNAHDAEDAVMNAVEYMCQNPEPFLNYTSDRTVGLIFLCVKQHAIDLYRRNRLQRKTFVDMDPEVASAIFSSEELTLDQIVVSKENRVMLAKAIRGLDEMYRLPIMLKYGYRMRNTDIAKFIHIDVNTVNGRIHRAKKKLALVMREMGYTLE